MRFGQRQQLERRIRIVIGKAEAIPDDELRSEIAKYLCILASGYLEAACKDIVMRFASPRANAEVCRYMDSSLDRFQNPGKEEILQLMGRFGVDKREHLEHQISQESADAVQSIVANRRQLAHGGNVGVSLAQIKQYYIQAQDFIGKFETTLLH